MPDGTTVDYNGLIPNNVGLNDDARVRKALETWHPGYIDWWTQMGPEGFQDKLVYLRTAVGVGSEGWAKFGYVRMPEYRWGVLLAPAVEGSHDRFWRAQGRASLAGSARRISRHAAPPAGHPGRYRTGVGGAAASSRRHRTLALRLAQPVPGECRGGPPSLGDGVSAAEVFWSRRAGGGGGIVAPPLGRPGQPSHAGRVQ